MDSLLCNEAGDLPLLKRDIPADIVTEGEPVVSGRCVWVSGDRLAAVAVWSMTPGTLALSPDPNTADVAVVLSGRAEVRPKQGEPVTLKAGGIVSFPTQPYELRVLETLRKVSYIKSTAPLALRPEPLD